MVLRRIHLSHADPADDLLDLLLQTEALNNTNDREALDSKILAGLVVKALSTKWQERLLSIDPVTFHQYKLESARARFELKDKLFEAFQGFTISLDSLHPLFHYLTWVGVDVRDTVTG